MHTTDRFTNLKQNKTAEGYKKLGVDLVAFVLYAASDRLPSGIKVDVPDEQRVIANEYYNAIVRQNGREKEVLQKLLYSMFTTNMGNRAPNTFPFYRFLVFSSFRTDGGFEACNKVTQVISKIVFFARTAIYNKIKELMRTEDKGFFTWVHSPTVDVLAR